MAAASTCGRVLQVLVLEGTFGSSTPSNAESRILAEVYLSDPHYMTSNDNSSNNTDDNNKADGSRETGTLTLELIASRGLFVERVWCLKGDQVWIVCACDNATFEQAPVIYIVDHSVPNMTPLWQRVLCTARSRQECIREQIPWHALADLAPEDQFCIVAARFFSPEPESEKLSHEVQTPEANMHIDSSYGRAQEVHTPSQGSRSFYNAQRPAHDDECYPDLPRERNHARQSAFARARDKSQSREHSFFLREMRASEEAHRREMQTQQEVFAKQLSAEREAAKSLLRTEREMLRGKLEHERALLWGERDALERIATAREAASHRALLAEKSTLQELLRAQTSFLEDKLHELELKHDLASAVMRLLSQDRAANDDGQDV